MINIECLGCQREGVNEDYGSQNSWVNHYIPTIYEGRDPGYKYQYCVCNECFKISSVISRVLGHLFDKCDCIDCNFNSGQIKALLEYEYNPDTYQESQDFYLKRMKEVLDTKRDNKYANKLTKESS